MSLNLWALEKPTSYNPLPTTPISLGIGEYIVNLKARRTTKVETTLRIRHIGFFDNNFSLTDEFQDIKVSWKATGVASFQIIDQSGLSNIEVKDIQLVEKPLGKATINGIEGFESGKWSLHANAKVIDDETLELNATGNYQDSFLWVNVLPNTNYTFSFDGNGKVWVGTNTGVLLNGVTSGNHSFTTDSNTLIKITLTSWNLGTGKFTFKRPMLYLGTLQGVPYSKKTGERMVLPQKWEDGTIHINPKPKGLVLKKNYYDKSLPLTGSKMLNGNTGTIVSWGSSWNVTDYLPIEENKTLIRDGFGNLGAYEEIAFYNESKQYISSVNAGNDEPFTTPKDARYLRTNVISDSISSAIIYNPLELTNPSARQGTRFNGNSYVQLPTHTMDSVEIECSIDVVQPNSSPCLIDARDGLENSWFSLTGNVGAGWSKLFVNEVEKPSKLWTDLPKNERVKVKLQAISSFVDNVSVFSNNLGVSVNNAKGTLYKVTTYLNGVKQQQYDFTKPIENGVVYEGEQPRNLLPSFDSGEWNLHANARVLGRDALELRATGNNQSSDIIIECLPSKNYKLIIPIGRFHVYTKRSDNTIANTYYDRVGEFSFTTPSDVVKIELRATNSGLGNGTFTFQAPRLIKVPPNQATITGGAVPQVKRAKRQLFAKR